MPPASYGVKIIRKSKFLLAPLENFVPF